MRLQIGSAAGRVNKTVGLLRLVVNLVVFVEFAMRSWLDSPPVYGRKSLTAEPGHEHTVCHKWTEGYRSLLQISKQPEPQIPMARFCGVY